MTAGIALVAGTIFAVASAPLLASAVPSQTIDFLASGYSLGATKPAGENGWTQGRAGDFSLVSNDTFPNATLAAGGRSLQISNAIVNGGGGQLVSPGVDAAGEAYASNTFEATFTVASATGAEQPNLNVDVNLDGVSRYGGVINLRHTPGGGLAVGSYWEPETATSTDPAQWRSAVFTTVSAAAPHTIHTVTRFLVGQPDTIDVYVDGTLVSAGSGVTTWEYYTTLAGSTTNRGANSLSFKGSGSAPTSDGIGYTSGLPQVPANAGLGFLITDIAYGSTVSSPPLPTDPPVLAPAPDAAPDGSIVLADAEVTVPELDFTTDGYLPYENAYVSIYSTPAFGGWFQANAAGVVSGHVVLPPTLAGGVHTIQLTGAISGRVTSTSFTFVALAATGSPVAPVASLGGALVLTGGALLTAVALRRRRTHRA